MMGKINRFIWIFILSFCSFLSGEESKQNILVLCSNGGYGHNAAAQTLRNLLGEEYNLRVVYPIDEIRIWGVKSGEQFYNVLLQNNWTYSLNFISNYVAPKMFRSRKGKVEEIIRKHIEMAKPDLVISLIPFVNNPASEAARKSGIPYLLVTTDNDLRLWVHGMQGIRHPDFKVTVGSDLWCSRELIRKRNIPDSAIETIGLPIRTDFFSTKDRATLKKEYAIPEKKPVILIMIGGAGGEKTLKYTKTLGSIQLGVHLIACAGKNLELAGELRKLSLHPTNSITVMEFTPKISDLMAVSDLIITKAGPGTITEAMTMKLPILVDSTSKVLSWERANIEMIMQYGIGEYIESFDELEPLVRRFVFDTELRKEISDAYKSVPENRFKEAIVPIVKTMCRKKN